MKICFEWPNSDDNIAFEHQGQFGRIECAMSLKCNIANKMENTIQCAGRRSLRGKKHWIEKIFILIQGGVFSR